MVPEFIERKGRASRSVSRTTRSRSSTLALWASDKSTYHLTHCLLPKGGNDTCPGLFLYWPRVTEAVCFVSNGVLFLFVVVEAGKSKSTSGAKFMIMTVEMNYTHAQTMHKL